MNELTRRAERAVTWLATQPGDYDPTSGRGPDWGKAAPIGLLIILLLGVALFFLIRSMNKNLRRVPASFDAPEPTAAGTATDVPPDATTTGGPAGSTDSSVAASGPAATFGPATGPAREDHPPTR